MEVSYQQYRHAPLSARGREIEEAVKEIDEYLYVDTRHQQSGALQLWRKHPLAHLPLPIFDIPSTASLGEVLHRLHSTDQRSHDIGRESAVISSNKMKQAKVERRYKAETFARELGQFIQKNL